MKDSKKVFQLFKQNSELEVLISAAIVFTAFVINDVAGDWIIKALNLNISGSSPTLAIVAIAALYMSAILPISLISHFILRIYWLSLVGLKSAYPEFKKEDVTPKFHRFVNGSLNIEKQIAIIDKICSSIFAFTFLTLFAFLFTFVSLTVIIYLIELIDDPFGIAENLVRLILILCLIYLIDFLTLGWFKKIKWKWFSRIYYPIYRVFGWVTFAGLYRGIYYTLIQYASKKVMIFITPIYIVIALFLLNQGYSSHTLYPENGGFRLDDELIASESYQNQFVERMVVRSPFIESYTIPASRNSIQLFIPLTQFLEEDILEHCEGIEPFTKRGVHWRKWLQMDWNRIKYDSTFDYQQNANLILDCVATNSTISIDSVNYPNQKFYFSSIDFPADYGVITTMLDISNLERGDHLVILKSGFEEDDELMIPIWRD